MPHEVVQTLCCPLPASPSLFSWEGHFPGNMLPPSSFESLDFGHDGGRGGPCPLSPPRRVRGRAPTMPCAASSGRSSRLLGLFPCLRAYAGLVGMHRPEGISRGCLRLDGPITLFSGSHQAQPSRPTTWTTQARAWSPGATAEPAEIGVRSAKSSGGSLRGTAAWVRGPGRGEPVRGGAREGQDSSRPLLPHPKLPGWR